MKRSPLMFGALLACAPLNHSLAVELTQDLALQIDTALVSDYRSRGISQTLGDPAAQLGATLQHSSGLYLGAWTSNVDFGDGLNTRQELDYYAGWYWQASEAVSLDLGYLRYSYPKDAQFNQSEVYAVLSAYGFELGGYYSNDMPTYFGERQSNLYSYLGYGAELPGAIQLKLRVGRNDAKDPLYVAAGGDTRSSYHEWEAKLSRELFGVTWGLSYIDTDLSKAECFSNWGYDDLCSATVVASAAKRF